MPKIHIAPRKRIIILVLAIFAGHTVCIWIYGICYWLLSNLGWLGEVNGAVNQDFFYYIYFSATTYSSLGIGDVFPTEELRFITSVEVLNGLVFIGWSVSLTYLAMEKFWDLHKPRGHKK